MAEEKSQEKWEGEVSAQLKGSKARDVWPLVADFCSLHKWFPTIDTCHQVDGSVTGVQPGVIRYCGSTVTSPSGETTIKWAKEKLIEIDPIQRRLRYEVLGNNVGFKYWVANMQVLPIDGTDDGGGSEIKWSFVGDPAEGWTYEIMLSYYDSSLQSI
ncbi:lachrymatory-factor synthase-like, partial [Morus notabilis]